MKGRISMSSKELSRYDELTKAHEGRQTLLQAAENLGLSKSQVLRLSKELKTRGPSGLVSKKVGAPSSHRLPGALREMVLAFVRERYSDFGPTLAHQYLTEEHQLEISINLSFEFEVAGSPRDKSRKT